MERLTPVADRNALGGPILHLDTIGSTNDRARELAADGAPHGTVVVAEDQTAGRGRQGRTWIAPRGRALTLSAIARIGAATLELLPLAAALAVCEACEEVAAVRCAVKWPNDVWIDERKTAGILIEARPQEGWAVIGIGLNVGTDEQELAAEIRETATSLRIATGREIDRERTLAALLTALARRLAADREELLPAYRERDALSGREIAWSAGAKRLEGEARGIDGEGNLVVFDRDGERHALTAGEVHLVS